MRKFFSIILVVYLGVFLVGCSNTSANKGTSDSKTIQKKEVILGMTTSIEDSGLLDVIIPAFEKESGYKTKTVSVGTGQALALAEKGQVDALLVNSPAAEKQVIEEGIIVNRKLVMHNDFVIVGSESDKAKIKGMKDAVAAFTAIAKTQSEFVSRSDDSGTNKLEKKLWSDANVKPQGAWYIEAGAGMGQTLKISNEKRAYTLADRATYLNDRKILSLPVLVEGDKKLLNLYSVSEINPAKFSKANSEGAKAFSNFLLSKKGQELIANYGKDKFGEVLFYSDGGKSDKDYGI
ncbi:substrate-binding domain-containing protein [Clostridium pasteurianum]|uniref:ABC-type tungstate transport system, permease component n=1 Tax=Clostridium pasteurianum BC1 TaxID=86416 RepID=R4K531_CLOPA|nr:substrate-binding domain-containing protein [Clostridium pasteurianum]AGK98272.1 ABC-type tungstate transport system, permease component [Clostridium pasteurianum BC1]